MKLLFNSPAALIWLTGSCLLYSFLNWTADGRRDNHTFFSAFIWGVICMDVLELYSLTDRNSMTRGSGGSDKQCLIPGKNDKRFIYENVHQSVSSAFYSILMCAMTDSKEDSSNNYRA